jgi:acyl-CoA synthetase (AMP-forming)/AMP-acid ligase II
MEVTLIFLDAALLPLQIAMKLPAKRCLPLSHACLPSPTPMSCMQLGATDADRMLALTTICFDIAGLEIFLPLLVGGTLLLATREQAMDPEELSAFIKNTDPTIMQATPTTWRMLLRYGWPGAPRLKALCGGEALPFELKEDLLPRVDSLRCASDLTMLCWGEGADWYWFLVGSSCVRPNKQR